MNYAAMDSFVFMSFLSMNLYLQDKFFEIQLLGQKISSLVILINPASP